MISWQVSEGKTLLIGETWFVHDGDEHQWNFFHLRLWQELQLFHYGIAIGEFPIKVRNNMFRKLGENRGYIGKALQVFNWRSERIPKSMLQGIYYWSLRAIPYLICMIWPTKETIWHVTCDVTFGLCPTRRHMWIGLQPVNHWWCRAVSNLNQIRPVPFKEIYWTGAGQIVYAANVKLYMPHLYIT